MTTHESKLYKQWLIAVLCILAVLALIVMVPLTVAIFVGGNALSEQLKSLHDANEPLTFEAWYDRLPPVPDGPTSVTIIEELKPTLDEIHGQYEDATDLFLIGGADWPAPGEHWPEAGVTAVESLLEAHETLLSSLRPIENLSIGRRSIELGMDPLLFMLPSLRHVRCAARVEALAAVRDASRGAFVHAVSRVMIMFNIAQITDDDPILISSLVTVANDSTAIKTMEVVLAVGEPDAHLLQTWQNRCLERERSSVFANGLRGERIGQSAVARMIRRTGVKQAFVAQGSTIPFGFEILANALIDLNQAKMLELMAPLIQASDSPRAMIDAAKAMEKSIPNSPHYFIARMFLPHLSRACELGAMRVALLCAGRTAMAAERYRIEHNRWPQQLADLVPDYLESVPTDPFDDLPVRYRVHPDRIIIYSISENLVDDGGDVEQPPGNAKRRPDIGFQLLDPELRGFTIAESDEIEPSAATAAPPN